VEKERQDVPTCLLPRDHAMDASMATCSTLPQPRIKPTHWRQGSILWLASALLLLVCVSAVLAEAANVFLGRNFRTVVPGQCYRSAQPNALMLAEVKEAHGILSILNLRDENEDESWYQEEVQAAKKLGIKLVNVGLSSRAQPPEHDFVRFVDGMDACPQPMLIHCASGNDRTGLASAVYMLLYTNVTPAEARGQLTMRYGHIPWGKAACLQRILDNYETWLCETNQTHSPDNFRLWARTAYRPE